MKILINTILLLFITLTASYADEVSHKAAAEELLLVMKTDQMMQPMYQEIRKMMFDMSKQMGISEEESELFNRHMDRLISLLEDEFGWNKLKNDFIRIYQETYTEEELNSFIAFYKTPSGQKLIEKMPVLMKKSMEISQRNMPLMIEKMKVLQAQMMEDIQNEMAKKQTQEKNKAKEL